MAHERGSATMIQRGTPASAELPSPTLESYFGFLRRQYLAILGCLLLSASVFVFYWYTTSTTYTASATIIIDPRKSLFLQQRPVSGDALLDTASINSAWIDSQLGILKLESEKLALSVARDLQLAREPEFVGSDIGSEKPEPELLQRAASALASRLEVKRLGASYLIRIEFTSLNPQQATRIANAVADAYIVEDSSAKYQMIRRANAWFQERLKTLREQASGAEAAVVKFKAEKNIVAAGGRLMSDQQLAELNSQLVAARVHTVETQARLS